MNSSAERLSDEALSRLLSAVASATTDEERALLEEQIVASFLPLAARLAAGYRDRGADLDDLVAVANFALVKAIRGFHPERGAFAAYASATILGEIKKYFRDFCWTIRPPRAIQELHADIARATEALTQAHGVATNQAIADHLGVDISRVVDALSAAGHFRPRSLDDPSGGDRPLGHALPDVDDRYVRVDEVLTLACGCGNLTSKERELLSLRFYEDRTQTQIAEVLGISQTQVSRLLVAVLDKIRSHPRLRDAA